MIAAFLRRDRRLTGRETCASGKRGIMAQAAAAAGALVLSLAITAGAAWAQDKSQDKTQDKTYVMKITLPTLHDTVHQVAINYAAAVEKDSGGRIKAEVYPASQLGSIPRQIEGVQFGSIQCAMIPPEFFVGVDQRFEVMAAPGLVNSMEHGQRLAADPGGIEADARARRRQGAARRWHVHGDDVLDHLQNPDPPHRRLQGQEDPKSSPRNSKAWHSSGLA